VTNTSTINFIGGPGIVIGSTNNGGVSDTTITDTNLTGAGTSQLFASTNTALTGVVGTSSSTFVVITNNSGGGMNATFTVATNNANVFISISLDIVVSGIAVTVATTYQCTVDGSEINSGQGRCEQDILATMTGTSELVNYTWQAKGLAKGAHTVNINWDTTGGTLGQTAAAGASFQLNVWQASQ
jgi:hypothetical protein